VETKANSGGGSPSRPRKSRWPVVIVLVFLAAGLSAAVYVVWFGGESVGSDIPTAVVQRGPLTISVTESGTIQSRERIVLKSEVEGTARILFLVEEGNRVRKGELLVELDSSGLQEQKDQQKIVVLNADASFIGARENLAVTQSQTDSDIAQAKLAQRFAELDLRKYLEGEYPQESQKAQSDITIAQEELGRASEKVRWDKKLLAQGFVTESELQADELAAKRAQITLDLAKGRLQLLEKYTHQRSLEKLNSDVKQSEEALKRTTLKASADLVQARAQLKAKESEFQRQKAKQEKIEAQLAKCRIVAPMDGMVVHATTGQFRRRGNVEPLAEGQQVRERQALIRLPTTSAMTAEIKVRESSLRKVSAGMPVRITVDAVPGQVFWGRVAKIGVIPDSQSAWLNPDLKVYTTRIDLEGDTNVLRPGMTCRAEVLVEEHEDALYVPVQAVVRIGTETAVYVPTADGFEPRTVTVGLDNNRLIHVIAGLQKGERVSMAPPLAASAVPLESQPRRPGESRPAATSAPAASSPGAATSGPSSIDPSRLRDMSPEQRRKWLRSLTPEQRAKLRQRGQRSGGRRGSRRSGGEQP